MLSLLLCWLRCAPSATSVTTWRTPRFSTLLLPQARAPVAYARCPVQPVTHVRVRTVLVPVEGLPTLFVQEVSPMVFEPDLFSEETFYCEMDSLSATPGDWLRRGSCAVLVLSVASLAAWLLALAV